MNILLINHYAGSLTKGMEYRPFYFAREWVRAGHNVTIVGGSFSHVRSTQPEFSGDVAEEEEEGVRYVWLRTPPYEGNGPKRALSMFAFVAQLFRHRKRLCKVRPAIAIASSTYPLDLVAAAHIAKRCGAKLIYEVHDLWPLSPIELGGMSPAHPFIALIQWAENFGYRKADLIVSMLPKAREHMERHGMSPHKWNYIPNGIDIHEWESDARPLPAEHAGLIKARREAGHFLVGYAGAHGIANALETLVNAAELLRGEPVTLVVVGHGPEKAALQSQAARLGLDNLIFLPSVPKSCVPSLLAEMDALYIGLQRCPIFRFGISPNKLMDYMMAGKPIIQSIEAGNDMVRESQCGISVEPESPAATAAAIRELLSLSESERNEMGSRGRRYVLEHHDYRLLAAKFLDAMAVATGNAVSRKPNT